MLIVKIQKIKLKFDLTPLIVFFDLFLDQIIETSNKGNEFVLMNKIIDLIKHDNSYK